MHSEIFEKLPPTRLFFRCAVPAMVTMAFSVLYEIADGLFVGNFIGEDALAAVNLVMPFIMILFSLSNLIATDASVRISILLGERNRAEASKIFTFTLKVIFLAGVVIGLVSYFLAEPCIKLIARGATEQTIVYAIEYTRIFALFTPLMLIFYATDNYLRVCGKERFAMWLSVSMQILNILLDVVLIVFLKKGVQAAALTSCISISLGAIIALIDFGGDRLPLYFTGGTIRTSDLVSIIANSSSEFFSSISVSIMSIVFNFFLLVYSGTAAVAAFSTIIYVDNIVANLALGINESLQPAISYCYGAGLIRRVKSIFRRIVIGIIILYGFAFVFMMFASEYVVPLIVKPEQTELLSLTIIGMRFFSLSYLFGWVDTCLSSYFTALERPARSMLSALFGTLIIPIGSLFIMSNDYGLTGVWLSAFLSSVVSAAFSFILYGTMKIRRKRRYK